MPPPYETTLLYLEARAQSGNPADLEALGTYWLNQRSPNCEDYLKQAAAYRKLADYYTTQGLARKAFKYYHKAVTSQNDTEALIPLVRCYLHGYGTRQDTRKAHYYMLIVEREKPTNHKAFAHEIMMTNFNRPCTLL